MPCVVPTAVPVVLPANSSSIAYDALDSFGSMRNNCSPDSAVSSGAFGTANDTSSNCATTIGST